MRQPPWHFCGGGGALSILCGWVNFSPWFLPISFQFHLPLPIALGPTPPLPGRHLIYLSHSHLYSYSHHHLTTHHLISIHLYWWFVSIPQWAVLQHPNTVSIFFLPTSLIYVYVTSKFVCFGMNTIACLACVVVACCLLNSKHGKDVKQGMLCLSHVLYVLAALPSPSTCTNPCITFLTLQVGYLWTGLTGRDP